MVSKKIVVLISGVGTHTHTHPHKSDSNKLGASCSWCAPGLIFVIKFNHLHFDVCSIREFVNAVHCMCMGWSNV